MYGLTDDGNVERVALKDGNVSVETYAYIGGRPLGAAFDK